MSTVQKKAPSPDQIKRKNLRDRIKTLKEDVKNAEKELSEITPKQAPKKRLVLTDTMKIAQSVGTKTATLSSADKAKIPAEFRTTCSKVVGLANINEVTRSQIDAVVKKGLALLEIMPKPERKKKPSE